MSKRKLIASIAFFLSIFGFTFYIIFSQNDISSIASALTSVNVGVLSIGIILMMLYFLMQALYMKMMLKTLNIKASLRKGIFYSIVEFFFSAITPSSTGGQPVQLYYMSKDKIPTEKSLIVLILNSIMFKLFTFLFGILILIFNPSLVFGNGIATTLLFALGMIVDFAIIVVCILMMYHKALIEKVVSIFYKIVNKVTKKNIDRTEKISQALEKYSKNANYVKHHKKEVLLGTILTFIQRIFMFSITYVVYRGLGLSGISYFNLLLLQTFTYITIEGLPLPGGTGALEAIINNVYLGIFGELTLVGTLLTRTLSFYLPLLVVMMIIIVVTRVNYSSKKNSQKKTKRIKADI